MTVAVLALLALVPLAVAMAPSAAAGTPTEPEPIASQAYVAPGLIEASGLTASVLHPGLIWVSEDSGEPILRAFDPAGNQVGSILFTASDVFAGDNRDTEALSMGPGPTLWSADIGDNNAVRKTVLVHTTPEPAELSESTVTATSYRFTYPDGPRDAEAFLVDPVDGRAYIASKGLIGGGALYAAPATLQPGATHELSRVQDLPGLLTDGAFSPDGSLVALRTLGFGTGSSATFYDIARHGSGEPVTLEERARVALPVQTQGESLTFARDGTAVLVGSEGPTEPIWAVPVPADLVTVATAPPSTAAGTSDPAASAQQAAAAECGPAAPGACVTTRSSVIALVAAIAAVLLVAVAAMRRRR